MGTPSTGNSIGNYTICERIGTGGVGSVWKAVDVSLGRTVAIKMLRPELAGHEGFLERLRGEAQALARMNHPNIATVFNLLEEGDELHLVMEYVEGQTLAELLHERGKLDLRACFGLYHQALDGVQYAHEAGVVHRDLKPSNLMVNSRGLLKVLDFGIARVDGTERITRTGLLVGTPEYMAPEQVRGGDGSVASDIYALGILLYEMLVGHPPFTGDAEYDVLRMQVECEPSGPRAAGAGCSPEIESVLLRTLEKESGQRFQDVASLRKALVEAGAPAPPGWELATERVVGEAAAGRPIPSTDERKSPTVVPGDDALPVTQELLAPSETRTLLAQNEKPRGRRWPLATAALLVLAAAASLNWLDHRPSLQHGTAGTAETEPPAASNAARQAPTMPSHALVDGGTSVPADATAKTPPHDAEPAHPPGRNDARPASRPHAAAATPPASTTKRWEVRRR